MPQEKAIATITNSIADFQMVTNDAFLEKAEMLRPEIRHHEARPVSEVSISRDGRSWRADWKGTVQEAMKRRYGRGDSLILDFGSHFVGYPHIVLQSVGSPQDAPAYVAVRFGETPAEIGESTADYHGSISSSWLQESTSHIDVLPGEIPLHRRYAFRYMQITVLDTSPKYKLMIQDIVVDTVSSADRSALLPCREDLPEDLKRIDAVGARTLYECMQDVFEDGPKRDRRLWMGDFRVQALVNYETFKNYDLVKRCLYLFAGACMNGGQVGACLFTAPKVQVDDTALFDYSLLYVPTLYEYYEATGDSETLRELSETAFTQLRIAAEKLDERGIVRDDPSWWCFLDWNSELNKQAGAQGVYIYCLRYGLAIAELVGDEEEAARIREKLDAASEAARKYLWEPDLGFFVSGEDRQVSWISQVWMVLAGVFSKEENCALLRRLKMVDPRIRLISPYAHHYYVDALCHNGMETEITEYIRGYWGKMVEEGADCYWEVFDPLDPDASPYGSKAILSYCHAWSCTASYFIRKWL